MPALIFRKKMRMGRKPTECPAVMPGGFFYGFFLFGVSPEQTH